MYVWNTPNCSSRHVSILFFICLDYHPLSKLVGKVVEVGLTRSSHSTYLGKPDGLMIIVVSMILMVIMLMMICFFGMVYW